MQNYKPLDYFEIAEIEDLNLEEIISTQNRYKNLNILPSKEFKIPSISHHIWLVNPSYPKEIKDEDLINYRELVSKIDEINICFKHILWTNCKECIPKSLKVLSEMEVEVRDINDYAKKLKSVKFIKTLVEQKKFGIAADFLRIDILKEYGGFYSDLNYMVNFSPADYMKTYDFFTHTDRGGIFADVYMIAAKPHHPIIEETFSTIYRNFVNPPKYVSEALDSNMHIQDLTGVITYLPFNFAVLQNLNRNSTDFIIPLSSKLGDPSNAKQTHFTCEFATSEETIINRYCSYEVCLNELLGFDSSDGNSWFDESPLYND